MDTKTEDGHANAGRSPDVRSTDWLDVVLRVLNEAYESDPAAMHALVCNRVPCNQALADHPTIQVEVNKVALGESFHVGALGIINGLIEAAIGERVATQWSDADEHGKSQLLGFVRYTPNADVSDRRDNPRLTHAIRLTN